MSDEVLNAVNESGATGLDTDYILDNKEEYNTPIISDGDEWVKDTAAFEQEEELKTKALAQEPMRITSDKHRRKSFFEKVYGHNLDAEVPYNFHTWTPVQRATYKAWAGARNIIRRSGGAAAEMAGVVDLKDMDSVIEFSGIVANRQLTELKAVETQRPLTEAEQSKKLYLEAQALKWYQKGPEAVGVIGEQAFEWTLARGMIQHTRLGKMLSKTGWKLLNKVMPKALDKAMFSTPTAAYSALARVIKEQPMNVASLFIAGAVTPPGGFKDKDTPEAIAAAAKAGAIESAFAPLFFLEPAFIKMATPLKEPLKNVYTAAVTKAGTVFVEARAKYSSKKFVETATKEFIDTYIQDFQKEPSEQLVAQAKVLFKQITNQADEAAKQARTTGLLEDLAATTKAQGLLAEENIIPVRDPVKIFNDAVEEVATELAEKTRFHPVRQPDGRWTILDTVSQVELVSDVKPSQLGSALDAVADGFRVPDKYTKIPRTKVTANEEAGLRRLVRKLSSTATKAYRAGVENERVKSAVKIANLKDRINTVRTRRVDGLERQKAAEKLVRDVIDDPVDRDKLVKGIIGSESEAGYKTLLDRVSKKVDQIQMKDSVRSMRNTFKGLQSKSQYGTNFEKAPDDVRPILQKLYKGVDLDLKDPSIEDLANVQEDLIQFAKNTHNAIGGVSDDIPESTIEYLRQMSIKTSLTADDVRFLDDVATMVARRSELAHQVRVGAEDMAVDDAVRGAIDNILDKKLAPSKPDAPRRTVKDIWGVESDHPLTLIEKMFGKGTNISKALDDYYKGEGVAAGIERTTYDLWHKYLADNRIPMETVKGLSKKVSVKIGGQKFKLTKDELLGMAMFLRDPDNFDNLLKTEGVYIRDKMLTISDEFIDDIFAATSQLSDEEMNIGSAYFHINNSYHAPLVNDTSVYMNGKRIATDPLNYPRHRFIEPKSIGKRFGSKTIETHQRFMPREGGTDPIQFKAFTTDFMDTTRAVANYHGMAIPNRSLKGMLNNKQLTRKLTTHGYFKERENLLTIIDRAEGNTIRTAGSFESAAKKQLDRYVQGVLALRSSSVGTQISSVPAAKAEIAGKYFKALDAPGKNITEEIEAFSDFFWQRWNNRRISIEMGDIASSTSVQHHLMKQSSVVDKAMNPLIWGDKKAIGKIYMAVKREVADQGLTGTAARDAAIKRLEDVTRKTQPVWNIMNRSTFASDPGLFKKGFAIFRTAQEAQLNVLKRAEADFARTGNRKGLRQARLAVAQSVMAVSLWRGMWRKARLAGVGGLAAYMGVHIPKDDKDIAFETGKAIAKNAFGLLPGGPQLAEAIDIGVAKFLDGYEYRGYALDPYSNILGAVDMASTALNDIITESTKTQEIKVNKYGLVTETIDPEDVDWVKVSKDIAKILKASSLGTGIPGAAIVDDWVFPSLKRTEYDYVKKLGEVDHPDIVNIQAQADRFLKEHSELRSKQTKLNKKGQQLPEEDKQQLRDMSSTKMSIDLDIKYDMFNPQSVDTLQLQLDLYNKKRNKRGEIK